MQLRRPPPCGGQIRGADQGVGLGLGDAASRRSRSHKKKRAPSSIKFKRSVQRLAWPRPEISVADLDAIPRNQSASSGRCSEDVVVEGFDSDGNIRLARTSPTLHVSRRG